MEASWKPGHSAPPSIQAFLVGESVIEITLGLWSRSNCELAAARS